MSSTLLRFKNRRDSAESWTANNPILAEGEIGVELSEDSSIRPKIKIGDGVTKWNSLPYGYLSDIEIQELIDDAAFNAGSYLFASKANAEAGAQDTTVMSPATTAAALLPFFHAAANEAGIRFALARADAAGGGMVIIPAGNISIAAPIVLTGRVGFAGAGVSWDSQQNDITPNFGTILKPTGNFNVFEFNPTDNPDTTTAGNPSPIPLCIHGASIRDLGIDGDNVGAYGIKVGALNRSGMTPINIVNVAVTRCQQWGVWIENSQSGIIDRVAAFRCGVGQIALGSSTVRDLAWNMGNLIVQGLYACPYNLTARKISIFARNGASLNALTMIDVESVAAGVFNYSGTATYTAANPAIAVADLTKWAVGSAAFFSSTVGNITTQTTYFVVSKSAASGAGTIQISLELNGTVLTPSTSGSATVVTRGPALLEVAAYGTGSNGASNITNLKILSLDLEGSGGPDLLVQKVADSTIDCGFWSGNDPSICVRSCDHTLQIRNPKLINATDFDANSRRLLYTGIAPTTYWGGYTGAGLQYDRAKFGWRLNLEGEGESAFIGNSQRYNQARAALRFLRTDKGNGTDFGNPNEGNIFVYNGGSNGASTLPTISENTSNNDGNVGLTLFLVNPSQVNWTINTNGAQNVNGTAATSFVVPAQSMRVVVASKVNSTFFWSVNPNLSTVTSAISRVCIAGMNLFTGSTAGQTYTLPPPAAQGTPVIIKNQSSQSLTVASDSGSQIFTTSAQASVSLAAGAQAVFYPDGTYWNQ